MSLTTKQKQAANRTLSKLDADKRRKIREVIGEVGSGGNEPIAEYLFDTAGAGTWEKPNFGSTVEIWICGGGKGGGSGRKGAAGSIRAGGNNGTPATSVRIRTPISMADLPSQISFLIGAGGAGGAPVTANDTNGNAGSNGSATTITIGSNTASSSGATFSGEGGGTVAPVVNSGPTWVDANPSGIRPFSPEATSGFGGWIDASNEIQPPRPAFNLVYVPTPEPGADVLRSFGNSGFTEIAATARGGAASTTGNGQKGGDGVLGLPGAGGGAATNDVGNSGAGGRGGDGFVYIAVYA